MIENIVESPILYGIFGGALYGLTFAGKYRVEGEPFEPLRLALTVVLGALIGLLFEIAGLTPDAELWYLFLAAFAGLVMEVEQLLKFVIRGQTEEAKGTLPAAGEAARQGARTSIGALAGERTPERIEAELRSRAPEGYGPDPDVDHDAAIHRARQRMNDITDNPESINDERFINDEPGESGLSPSAEDDAAIGDEDGADDEDAGENDDDSPESIHRVEHGG